MDGLYSYWAAAKYFYLSQSDLKLFSSDERKFAFRAETGNAGIILSGRERFKGNSRTNKRQKVSLGSSAIDIDFYTDSIMVFSSVSGRYSSSKTLIMSIQI